MKRVRKPKRQFLQVYLYDSGEVIHELEVTGRPERHIERVMLGMLTNMRPDANIRQVER